MDEKILRNGRFSVIYMALILVFSILTITAGAQVSQKLYVTHPQFYQDGNSVVSVINLSNKSLVSEIYTTAGADKIAFNIDKVFVFSSQKGRCDVFDYVTDKLLFSFSTGGPVADFCFSHTGQRLYICNGSSSKDPQNSVSMFATEDGELLNQFSVGKNPQAIEISVDDQYLFVADARLGVVTQLELTNFDIISTFYAGVNPTDLELSWDGKDLLISSGNFPLESGTGGGITVFDISRKKIKGYYQTMENLINIEVISSDRIIGLDRKSGRSRLSFFDYTEKDEFINISSVNSVNLSGEANDITIISKQNTALISFQDGSVKAYNLSLFQQNYALTDLTDNYSDGITLASIDYNVELLKRDSLISYDPQTDEARTAFFEKAYIYRTMGNKNSEVKVYNNLATQYPGTKTEVMSYIRLGDLCYNDLLYANSADFYDRAFSAYVRYMENTGGSSEIDDNYLFSALHKLGELATTQNKKYLNNIVSNLEMVNISSVQVTELYYLLAYHLKKQGETKLARRCLDEIERLMISLNDDRLFQRLRNKIDLLNAESRVYLQAQKLKKVPSIDGDPSEWKDKHSLYIDRRTDLLVNGFRWLDMDDVSAEIRVAYDQSNLYILGIITDNILFKSDLTKRDRVKIYLDYGETAANFLTREKAGTKNLFELVIEPPVTPEGQFAYKHPNNVQPVFGAAVNSTGYTFEIKIPYVYLQGFNPKVNKQIGFGIEIWDADSNAPRDPLKIMGWVAPTESIDGDRDFRMLGILQF